MPRPMYRKSDRPAELVGIYAALEALETHLPTPGPGRLTKAHAALEVARWRLDQLGERINAATARRAA